MAAESEWLAAGIERGGAVRLLVGLFGAVFLVLVFSSCGTKSKVSPPCRIVSLALPDVSNRLVDHYEQWRLVPYQRGGMSKRGIDCSGFVSMTYRERFGLSVPRTTGELADCGREVDPAEAQPGDLILFKTGMFTRHAGILIDRDRFIHVSTGRGVMLSSLDESYWRERLWQVRRILR